MVTCPGLSMLTAASKHPDQYFQMIKNITCASTEYQSSYVLYNYMEIRNDSLLHQLVLPLLAYSKDKQDKE